MAFEKEKVEGNSAYTDMKLGDQENGFVITFYYDNKATATSADYGDFEILQGIGMQFEAETEAQLLNETKLISFVPNTMIKNLLASGGLTRGETYIVTKKWTKGDSFGKKKAKGHGYDIQHVKLPDNLLDQLKARHLELLPDELKKASVQDKPEI